MTSMKKYAGSSYVNIDDVKDGPVQAIIINVAVGNFEKPVLHLDSGRHFSLNATNVKTLIAAFGEDDKDWMGMRIELFAGFTKYQGKEQESVLVRAISRGKPISERTTPSLEQSGNDIPY